MYDSDGSNMTRPLSHMGNVIQYSMYAPYSNNKGGIEAQCVYAADKIAYLLSDLEDGIRRRIFLLSNIDRDPLIRLLIRRYCRLRSGERQLRVRSSDDFLRFRSMALTVLILDIVETAEKAIRAAGCDSPDQVLSNDARLVWVSEDIAAAWDEFYLKWMTQDLYVHRDVTACNVKARKIIEDLFEVYIVERNLVEPEYRERCQKAYSSIGITDPRILDLIVTRNYIAGMTDAYAIDRHARLFMSSERIMFS